MNIKKIILLGGHIQALGLARQACQSGVDVYLCIKDPFSVARYSKCVKNAYVCKSEEELENVLNTFIDINTLLFPTSDDYIEFIVKHYNVLYNKVLLGIPDPAIVNMFCDKRNASRYIDSIAVPQPKTLCPDTFEDCIHIAESIEYPIVIKPAIMYSFHEKFGKKAYLCHNRSEFLDKIKYITDNEYPLDKLIFQEYLCGGAKNLYSYGAFVVEGNVKAWIIANRIRQNPMDFGNSTTFAISCYVPEIEVYAKKIFKDTKYTGLAEVEFMYDDKECKYKFLEINTRAWKWHSLSEAYSWGFMSELIKYYNSEDSSFIAPIGDMGWVEHITDFSIILRLLTSGRINLGDIIKSYRIKKVNAVWSWRDIKPAIMYLLLSPILYFKRY